MGEFVLERVETLDEAVELLADDDLDAAILGGGQSLIPMMNAGLAAPKALIDITRAAGARSWERREGSVKIGPAVRHRDIEDGRIAHDAEVPLLRPAARLIAHQAVRNRGTFAGSIAHADPAAEWPAVAVALDALIELRSVSGERSVPAAEFFLGPMTTDRALDELVVSVTIPLFPERTGAAVRELTYRSGDYAVVGVMAQLSRGGDEQITDARIALLGVGPTPVRAREAERFVLEGGSSAFEEAGYAAVSSADPIDDATASADYRRKMIPVFVRRALAGALADCDRRNPESPR
jgi:aerobic carbon-monoxide dehydrogenase medium subunit